jgi:shikimate dehydrogenase
MPRAAVLGKPVGHSLSPVLHTAGYAAAGLAGWSYTAIECAETELAALVAGLGPEWAGLSLTMPLKEVALAVADEVAPLAATLGAGNTLVRAPGGWRAENTDAPGIVEALGVVPGGAQVVVLGAGGTARAALGAAARIGAAQVTVVARRPAAAALDPVAATLGVPLTYRPWLAAPAALATADLVVSTVPAGVADPLAPVVRWRDGAVLLDALYHPWPTPLAEAAAAAGCRVVSGLDLLLAQAAGQFTLYTGVAAPVDAMRAALMAAAFRSDIRR